MFVLKPIKRIAILSQVGRAAGRTMPLKLRTNWRGIRREGVKVGEKVSLCKEKHASEVVRRLAG